MNSRERISRSRTMQKIEYFIMLLWVSLVVISMVYRLILGPSLVAGGIFAFSVLLVIPYFIAWVINEAFFDGLSHRRRGPDIEDWDSDNF